MQDIKITRNLLNNYRKLKKEIPLLEYELKEMQTTDAGIGNSTVFDYRSGFPVPQSVVGFDWKLYEQRKIVLENKRKKLEVIEAWVNCIEEVQTRCIFKMRYIDGRNWTDIAIKTGYGNSPDYPRIMIRDKYLKENKII